MVTKFDEVVARLVEAAPPEAELEAEELQRREAARLVSLADRLGTADVPARLARVVLDGPRETEAIRAIGAWNQGGRTFLFLAGGVGTGKSVAAAFALGIHGGHWTRAVDVVRLGQFEREDVERLERARCLVIDDLGAEPLDAGGWGASAILSLLDVRYHEMRRTLITTNLTGAQVLARYGRDGGRLLDRLRESGTWVNLTGESMRVASGSSLPASGSSGTDPRDPPPVPPSAGQDEQGGNL